MRVRLTKQARRDLAQAAKWYEAKREGLGDEFLDRVQEGLDQIGLNPLGYSKLRGQKHQVGIYGFDAIDPLLRDIEQNARKNGLDGLLGSDGPKDESKENSL